MRTTLSLATIIILCAASYHYFPRKQSSSLHNKKIVIVGAGLAGLTAGYRLAQNNADVHVYEAKNRVGGRIFSAFINDHVVELGGESIADGGGAENIRQLIEELGLTVEPIENNFFDNFVQYNNSLYSINERIKEHHFDENMLREHREVVQRGSYSMRDVIKRLFPSDDILQAYFEGRLAMYEGASADQLSPLYTATLYTMIKDRIAEKESKICVRIKGGNSMLPFVLAQQLAGRVHLNMPVISITKNNKGQYIVYFKNGSAVVADILILAIPCPAYRTITFDRAVIPSERLAAIESIRNGENAKIIVPISNQYITKHVFVGKTVGMFTCNNRTETLFFIGQTSHFDQNSIEKTYHDAFSLLGSIFPHSSFEHQKPIVARDELFAHYDGPIGHSWPEDPYVQGSYSYMSPGQEALFTSVEDCRGLTVKTLFAPISQLYFAGEHSSTLQDVAGTMEAACQSGNLAAALVQQSMTK